MAVFVTEIPDLRFSGMMFPQIWQSLLVYRREYMPDLTDEDDNEPTIQILKAFAAGFHYCNVLLDHVARETLLPTARLRTSVKGHLALIGYELSEATPAEATLLASLASPITSATTLPALSKFSTKATADADAINFELLSEVSIDPTDVLSYCYEDDGGSFTDITDVANGSGTRSLWGGVPAPNDAVYFGTATAIYDAIGLALSVVGDLFDDENDYVFEYNDGSSADSMPSLVTDTSPTITFDLTNALGTNNRAGVDVTVTYNLTGATAVVESTWSGAANVAVVDASALGLAGAPSTNVQDYTVGVSWKEVPSAVVATSGATPIELGFTVPEGSSRAWARTAVDGTTAYWLRLRVVGATATSPTLSGATDVTVGTQYIKFDVAQGETHEDSSLVFDGTGYQSFSGSQPDAIDGTTRCFVTEGVSEHEYEELDDLLSAIETSRVFVAAYDEDGHVNVQFGDGVNGYKPPVSSTLRLVYRVDAIDDGNVGADQIVVNQSSASFVSSVRNPRPASGWSPAEGSTDASLAEAKIDGPATLRVRERAITLDDIRELAEGFVFASGSRLVDRALPVLDGFGEKTYKLLVVGIAGSQLTSSQLSELDEYFNGDPVTGLGGVLIAGYELASANYTMTLVDVTMTILGGDAATVTAALEAYLSPSLTKSNGDYEHTFGGVVYRNNIIAAAKNADPSVEAVLTLTDPAADVPLALGSLPYPGALAVTVV